MTTVYVGDTPEIVLDCGANISTATVRNIIVKKPDGSKIIWAASAEGTNSIKYVAVTGDIDLVGAWKVQAYIEMPTWKGHGSQTFFSVNKPL